MKAALQQLKSLSPSEIDASSEIQGWLFQFPEGQRSMAKLLLSRLQFVSRDVYSDWLRKTVASLPGDQVHALYSVRKLEDGQLFYWNEDGAPVARSGSSLGSEDLVYSLISNLVRSGSGRLLDHPSLSELKEMRIRSYVLIDDSIGSGDRVSGFINAMLNHQTFLSWWSFGWIKFHVLSFARPRESELKIISKIRGSDHGKRKFKKSSKVDFVSNIVYQQDWLEARWGENYQQLIDFCRGQTKVPTKRRLGYGDVMANIVFYHSVPNNLPGLLWCNNQKWDGLMSGRAIPDWLLALLDQRPDEVTRAGTFISDEMLRLLVLIKRGVRSTKSIALRLNVDHKYAIELLCQASLLGLLTSEMRLTATGIDRLKQSNQHDALPSWDLSLYIPGSWCAGRVTVQPPIQKELFAFLGLADSIEVSASADGDVGETSLEISDAKAAAPPFRVMLQSPAVSRENHDTDGPLGSKDR